MVLAGGREGAALLGLGFQDPELGVWSDCPRSQGMTPGTLGLRAEWEVKELIKLSAKADGRERKHRAGENWWVWI